jgi:hypothetical protein
VVDADIRGFSDAVKGGPETSLEHRIAERRIVLLVRWSRSDSPRSPSRTGKWSNPMEAPPETPDRLIAHASDPEDRRRRRSIADVRENLLTVFAHPNK